METDVFIARVAAVIYLSASVSGFVSPDAYRRLRDDLYKNAVLTYIMGLIAVILGAVVLRVHGRGEGGWTVLVAVIGWAALVKGVFLIVLPGFMSRATEPFMTDKALRAAPYLLLALGLLFACFGFIHA